MSIPLALYSQPTDRVLHCAEDFGFRRAHGEHEYAVIAHFMRDCIVDQDEFAHRHALGGVNSTLADR
jgi:hypothetical protein